ncbi:MAG: hypothetical protein Kow0020_13070 [Wenzhouxiangellaceae bacterium]
MKKISISLIIAGALVAIGATAQSGKSGAPGVIYSADGAVAVQSVSGAPAPQGIAPACLDVTGIASWDGLDDTDNIVIDLNIGAGNSLTGVAWDVNIATVGGSWRSEARVLLSDSTGSADPEGIVITPGFADSSSGQSDYSSGGVIDFSDNSLPDITTQPDGILRLQFYDSFDDFADAVDANWSNIQGGPAAVCDGIALVCSDQAACNAALGAGGPVLPEINPVPANNPWALGLLVLVLAGLGIVAVRRFV